MKSEKAIATNDGSNTNFNGLTMQIIQKNTTKINTIWEILERALVCDECAAPLQLYGSNFIETYTNGRVNVLRCLCDLHAGEMEVDEK